MGAARQWLALVRAPGLGPAAARAALERLGAPDAPGALLGAAPRALSAAGLAAETRRWLAAPDWSAVDADLEWLERPGRTLVALPDAAYPERLRGIAGAPLVLFVRGDPEVLALPQLAIVGSRNPTPAGADNARAFARAFAGAGLAITSGLAAGVDAAAHRGALDVSGITLAVAGNGLDRVYPAHHRALAERILEHGAIVSEHPPGTPPLAANFPRRNRIISALALGVLVAEAARRSGSLITARLAAEQGREVFAIPGSIHNPLARGCHRLIREGAKLVESADDVLEELAPQLGGAIAALAGRGAGGADGAEGEREAALDADYRALLDALGYEPASVDALVERTGLTTDVVSSMLLMLELKGYVSSAPGALYVRVADHTDAHAGP